LTFEFRNWKPY